MCINRCLLWTLHQLSFLVIYCYFCEQPCLGSNIKLPEFCTKNYQTTNLNKVTNVLRKETVKTELSKNLVSIVFIGGIKMSNKLLLFQGQAGYFYIYWPIYTQNFNFFFTGNPRSSTMLCLQRPESTTTVEITLSLALHVESTTEYAHWPSQTLVTLILSRRCPRHRLN